MNECVPACRVLMLRCCRTGIAHSDTGKGRASNANGQSGPVWRRGAVGSGPCLQSHRRRPQGAVTLRGAGPALARLPVFQRKPEIGIYLLFLSYCERMQIF